LDSLTLASGFRLPAALVQSDSSPELVLLSKRERHALEATVRDVLAELDVRERTIAGRRWMVDEESAETLSELGRELGLSRERVRQLEVKLKDRLSKHFRRLSRSGEADWLSA
jgi:RNA polymerase primary sigma factor